jgi:hypothetical protein
MEQREQLRSARSDDNQGLGAAGIFRPEQALN